MLNREQLETLRNDIVLNSVYVADYENSLDISASVASGFFFGYLDYLEELMREDDNNYNDSMFYDKLETYDNIDNLEDWYYCFDPLPF